MLMQSLAQWRIDLAVAAEPYYVPQSHPYWAGDLDGSVAIIGRAGGGPPLSLLERGSGYVVAKWEEYAIVGAYFSPNRTVAELEVFVDLLAAAVRRQAPRQVLLMGDLNAKARAWGNPFTDTRGEVVREWAVATGLTLLNRGSVHTCVRHNGGSVVDLSFATPAVAARVQAWRVVSEVATLSDHNYIRFEIATSYTGGTRRVARADFPRWTISRLDAELAEEAAIVQSWLAAPTHPEVDVAADHFREAVTAVCDAAMPRSRRRPERRQVFWWCSEIEDLRTQCSETRRRYGHCRRRRHGRTNEELPAEQLAAERLLYGNFRLAKQELQLAIGRAKAQGWSEALDGLDRDPWGRPYKAARNKFRGRAPPIAESLEPELLERVLGGLFPDSDPHYTPPPMAMPSFQEEEDPASIPPISEAEMEVAVDRLRGKRTAPGPDGIPGRVLRIALREMGGRLRELFDACLTSGQFPKLWKDGRLCLLRKEGRDVSSPSAYRPIVLLDDTAKLLEKIVASRVIQHLGGTGPDLSEAQFGFRARRSTIDALLWIKGWTQDAVSGGEKALAVSLDIANAFNSLPHGTIREALRYHGVPLYLRRLLADYLQDREVLVEGRDGLRRRCVSCGVPQGSVLGPLLWNIGYDWVLRGTFPASMRVACYADDTLVVAKGRDLRETVRRATVATTLVVSRIRALGLEVALSKTEALMFHGPRGGPPPGTTLDLDGVPVRVGTQMRYLGLILDGRWTFGAHFTLLAPKVIGAAAALGRLLPNVGGPSATCRRLYSGVIRSMALYGAPVWVDALGRANKALLRRPQRVIATRAIRGYRTVSWTAGCVLAGDPPWELQAEILAEVYHFVAARRSRGEPTAWEEVTRMRRRARAALLRRWTEDLAPPVPGQRTVDAIRPVLRRWVGRRFGSLTFRLVQVLSGHGCFGKYLHHIARREATPACHECGAPEDTALHTLEECAAWGPMRHTLTAVIGADLSLPSVVNAMLGSDRSWQAVVSFCEAVMAQKEAAERAREDNVLSDPLRRRRTGGRRRRFGRLLSLS